MIIGIDIDGTFIPYRFFFSELCHLIREAGGKVYLITGLGKSGLKERMKKYVWLTDTTLYDGIYDTSLYNEEERALIGVEPNEHIVGRFKQRMCQQLGVQVMFDDQARIHRNFGIIPIFEVA